MDKNKKKINLIIYISLFVILSIINIRYINSAKNFNINFNNDDSLRKIIIIFSFIILLAFSIILYIKNKVKIEKLFLLVAIPLGLMYLIFIPYGQTPDEASHYLRSYSISNGNLITKTKGKSAIDEVPSLITKTVINESTEDNYKITYNNITNTDKTKYIMSFNTSAVYNFVVYIPQVIGILIGRILHLPVVLIGYMGRLFNLIAFITLIYFSIKLIPMFKKYVCLIGTLPIVLQQAASLSSDGLTIGSSIFFVSYVLYLKYRKETINKKDYSILLISTLIISLCKIVYLPLCLLIFIIPKEKFVSKKDKYFKLVICLLIAVISNLLWLKVASNYLTVTNPGVKPDLQVKYVLMYPFNYIKVLYNSFDNQIKGLMLQSVGNKLEVFNVDTGKIYPYLTLLVMLVLIFMDKLKNREFTILDRLLTIFIGISTVGLICTSLYIQWTPYEYYQVMGLQGRYFIPLFMFLPTIFINKFSNLSIKFKEIDNKYLLLFIIFMNLNAIFFIIISNV